MYTCIRRGKAPTAPRQATILRCRLALKLRLEQVRTCIKQTMYAMIDRRACQLIIIINNIHNLFALDNVFVIIVQAVY